SGEIQMQKGDFIYLLTDGYPSQLIEYKAGKMEDILAKINHLTPQEQKEELQEAMHDSHSELKQQDDILVLGIKV
ncbi:MAG: SpoIIE family protein phosphatase, partial [Bacteroidia bacterium]